MTPTERAAAVLKKIIRENPGQTVTWATITEAIRAKNIPGLNWAEVRNQIQGHIDAGELVKTADGRAEAYAVSRPKIG